MTPAARARLTRAATEGDPRNPLAPVWKKDLIAMLNDSPSPKDPLSEGINWQEVADARAEHMCALAARGDQFLRERDILIKLHQDLINVAQMREYTAHDFIEWMAKTKTAAAAISSPRPEGELADVLVMTGCKDRAELEDIANIGQSFMSRLGEVITTPGPFENWSPADDPAELVTDLLNSLEESLSAADELRDLLAQRTADITKAQPDSSIRRVSPAALDALATSAEAQWALAESDEERMEATALEMLVAWQREPAQPRPEGEETGWRPIESAPRDGSAVFLICADAYTPTPFEGWWAEDGQWGVKGAGWVHYSMPGHKLSGGVSKWFPTHWVPKDALLQPRPEPVSALPDDLFSHHASWRKGLELARDASDPAGEDHDDAAYWRHEIEVFDRVYVTLLNTPSSGGE